MINLEELRILRKLPMLAMFERDDGHHIEFRVKYKKEGIYTVEEIKNGKPQFVQGYTTARQAERFLYLRQRQLIHNHFKCVKIIKEKII